jgi:hypothetical protein
MLFSNKKLPTDSGGLSEETVGQCWMLQAREHWSSNKMSRRYRNEAEIFFHYKIIVLLELDKFEKVSVSHLRFGGSSGAYPDSSSYPTVRDDRWPPLARSFPAQSHGWAESCQRKRCSRGPAFRMGLKFSSPWLSLISANKFNFLSNCEELFVEFNSMNYITFSWSRWFAHLLLCRFDQSIQFGNVY